MEHASIAAFARFALELLAFGAPAELLAKTASAMSDEAAHARQAFALASAYAGAPRGPGALAVDGSLASPDLESSVLTAFLEGCIGETVAALEAREAATRAQDETVRAVLAKVADEEARHALLAYEFVQWALPRASAALANSLRITLRSELERADARAYSTDADSPFAAALVAHGILPESERRALRRSALHEVVAPCVEALLAAHEGEARITERRVAETLQPHGA
jgi:hypothetical protein